MGKLAVDGESPVGENAWSSEKHPSSGELLKFAVNLPGPPGKAEYFLATDSGRVP